jgi:NitT/TauT family transport system permease protein
MGLGSAIGSPWAARAASRLGDPWLIVLLNLPALVIIVLAYIWAGLTRRCRRRRGSQQAPLQP